MYEYYFRDEKYVNSILQSINYKQKLLEIKKYFIEKAIYSTIL